MRLNKAAQVPKKYTEGGSPAYPHLTPIQQLKRSVLACLLWEDAFYEDGISIADRIEQTAAEVSAEELAALAIEARTVFNLRHVPLLLLTALAKKGGGIVAEAMTKTIMRPDELTEFLSIYWRNGRVPLSAQVKKGLAEAFTKFPAYNLAKYNRDDKIKLRDVLFLSHAKPLNDEQAQTWKRLIDGTLTSPDTWEVNLSAGADKKETFTRLLKEGKLGYMALLRNLRNMTDAGVDLDLIKSAIIARKGAHRVLPFRYVAAARACPQLEPVIDKALMATVGEQQTLSGKTVILVDVSASMEQRLSKKGDLTCMDAAATLAAIWPGEARVYTFSWEIFEVPQRAGMSGIDAIIHSQPHSGTELTKAVEWVKNKIPHDRLIVITDEQSTSYNRLPDPSCELAYVINVASYKNGVGYGKWTHLDGFSESVIRWIVATEKGL